MQVQLKQPLTAEKLNLIRKHHAINQDRNEHSLNAVLLATYFGTPEQIAEAKDILNQHRKIGYLSEDLYNRRREIEQPLYQKMINA